jgi:hypothetical protein
MIDVDPLDIYVCKCCGEKWLKCSVSQWRPKITHRPKIDLKMLGIVVKTHRYKRPPFWI